MTITATVTEENAAISGRCSNVTIVMMYIAYDSVGERHALPQPRQPIMCAVCANEIHRYIVASLHCGANPLCLNNYAL